MSTVVKDLGAVSAYAYAVEKGYTGTEAEFAELMADYAEVGQRAEDAADSALESKTAAQTAATTATNKASEATTAATTATTKAGEASTSASTATSAKDTAVSASQTATTKATEATTAAATATSAKTDAVAANTAAQSAKTAAQTAQTGAETAAASVSASAEQIATNAEDISQLKSDLSTYDNSISEAYTGDGTKQVFKYKCEVGKTYMLHNKSSVQGTFGTCVQNGGLMENIASNFGQGYKEFSPQYATEYIFCTTSGAIDFEFYEKGLVRQDFYALGNSFGVLKTDVANITGIAKDNYAEWSSGYIQTGNVSVVDTSSIITDANYKHKIVSCGAGMLFEVTGTGGSAPRLWCVIDSEDNVLSVCQDSGLLHEKIVIPNNADRIVFNSSTEPTIYYGFNSTFLEDKFIRTSQVFGNITAVSASDLNAIIDTYNKLIIDTHLTITGRLVLGNSTQVIIDNAYVQINDNDLAISMSGSGASIIGKGMATINGKTSALGIEIGGGNKTQNCNRNTIKDLTISNFYTGINISNNQNDGYTVYFNILQNLYIHTCNIGIALRGNANAQQISTILFNKCGSSNYNFGAIVLRNINDQFPVDNSIMQVFHHGSANAITLNIEKTQYSTFTGIVCEQGGDSARSIKITSTETSDNHFELISNVRGGWYIPAECLNTNIFMDIQGKLNAPNDYN